MNLGATKPGQRVRFANGEVGTVVKHDSDDFDVWTQVRCPQRRKRSNDDAQRYCFKRTEQVEVLP